jgi:hypothetical protein
MISSVVEQNISSLRGYNGLPIALTIRGAKNESRKLQNQSKECQER